MINIFFFLFRNSFYTIITTKCTGVFYRWGGEGVYEYSRNIYFFSYLTMIAFNWNPTICLPSFPPLFSFSLKVCMIISLFEWESDRNLTEFGCMCYSGLERNNWGFSHIIYQALSKPSDEKKEKEKLTGDSCNK